MKIAVLMGGISEEREVSLASGIQVSRALREAGHEVLAVDTSQGVLPPAAEAALLESGIKAPSPERLTSDLLLTGDIGAFIEKTGIFAMDVVFPALHGGGGEDGTVQTLLELAGVTYVGSGRVGCALAMDKDISKRLLRDAGIPTPAWLLSRGRMEGEALLPLIEDKLGFPAIVKPPSGGSTLGLSLAHDEEELRAALDLSLKFGQDVMFEEYIQGSELTVGIVGKRALPVGEIIPEHEIFDYECKYSAGMAEEVFPAELPATVSARVQEAALQAHRTLGLRDFSRVDFILDRTGTAWCLEANALPGLTANSLLPKAALAGGISFPQLCQSLAEMAFGRAG